MKQKLTKITGETDNSLIIVGNFDILSSGMHRTTKLKISKEIEGLDDVINQQDLTGICRMLNRTLIECT
jgi:hypothetical protein